MSAASQFHVSPTHQPLFREIGLDGESVFTDERIKVWRSLPDRENCTLDERLADGRVIRLHIKRYPGGGRGSSLLRTPAGLEVAGYRLLAENGIPAAPLIAHGRLADGRNFVILQDLSGYTPADKLVERGTPFECFLKRQPASPPSFMRLVFITVIFIFAISWRVMSRFRWISS